MLVREKFEEDLQTLRNMLIQLGEYAEESLVKSFEAFETKNSELALQVLEDDEKANLLEEEINDFAVLLISKQQPVAVDCRRIIVAIKISADLERMADYGVNIAKATIRLGKDEHHFAIEELRTIYHYMVDMLKLAMEAYRDENFKHAKEIAQMDDQIDNIYKHFMKQLMTDSNLENVNQVMQISTVAKQIERAADHITNVTENIYYLVRGKHLDLNN